MRFESVKNLRRANGAKRLANGGESATLSGLPSRENKGRRKDCRTSEGADHTSSLEPEDYMTAGLFDESRLVRHDGLITDPAVYFR
jgi:hypothetical protein